MRLTTQVISTVTREPRSLGVSVMRSGTKNVSFFFYDDDNTQLIGHLRTNGSYTEVYTIEDYCYLLDSNPVYRNLETAMIEFLLRINAGQPLTIDAKKLKTVLKEAELEETLFLFQIFPSENEHERKCLQDFFKCKDPKDSNGDAITIIDNCTIKVQANISPRKTQLSEWKLRRAAIEESRMILARKEYVPGEIQKVCDSYVQTKNTSNAVSVSSSQSVMSSANTGIDSSNCGNKDRNVADILREVSGRIVASHSTEKKADKTGVRVEGRSILQVYNGMLAASASVSRIPSDCSNGINSIPSNKC